MTKVPVGSLAPGDAFVDRFRGRERVGKVVAVTDMGTTVRWQTSKQDCEFVDRHGKRKVIRGGNRWGPPQTVSSRFGVELADSVTPS